MKARLIFFIFLLPALAASALLMPSLPGKAIHKRGKISGLNLPNFQIGVPETSDYPLAFGKDQNFIIASDARDESEETKPSEHPTSDAAANKIEAPELFAMLSNSKTEAEPSGSSSQNTRNSGKDVGKNIRSESILGSGSTLHSKRQSPSNSRSSIPAGDKASRGSLSGRALPGSTPNSSDTGSPSSGGNSDPALISEEPEHPLDILSPTSIEEEWVLDDPLKPPDLISNWGLDPLLAGRPGSLPSIIIGIPSLSGDKLEDLDPDSPLNPLPPSEGSINPFAPPEFTPPRNQFPDRPPVGWRSGPPLRPAPTPAPVPEPGTVVLLGSGLVALFCYKRRFRKL